MQLSTKLQVATVYLVAARPRAQAVHGHRVCKNASVLLLVRRCHLSLLDNVITARRHSLLIPACCQWAHYADSVCTVWGHQCLSDEIFPSSTTRLSPSNAVTICPYKKSQCCRALWASASSADDTSSPVPRQGYSQANKPRSAHCCSFFDCISPASCI